MRFFRFIKKLLYLTLKLAVLISTLLLGTTLTHYTFEYFPQHVTLCQLASSPNYYNGKRVILEADVRSGMVLDETGPCTTGDAWAVFRPDDEMPVPAGAEPLMGDTTELIYSARVRMAGYFRPHKYMGCFGPTARFDVRQMELISNVTAKLIPPRDLE